MEETNGDVERMGRGTSLATPLSHSLRLGMLLCHATCAVSRKRVSRLCKASCFSLLLSGLFIART